MGFVKSVWTTRHLFHYKLFSQRSILFAQSLAAKYATFLDLVLDIQLLLEPKKSFKKKWRYYTKLLSSIQSGHFNYLNITHEFKQQQPPFYWCSIFSIRHQFTERCLENLISMPIKSSMFIICTSRWIKVYHEAHFYSVCFGAGGKVWLHFFVWGILWDIYI